MNRCNGILYWQANSDKLTNEIESFGCPPNFPQEVQEPESLTEEARDPADPTKKAKKAKSKVAAKSGGFKYQWQIMRSLGMDDSEIKQYVWVGCVIVRAD